MSAITCKYHPKDPARWTCTHCQINFCVNCVQRVRPDSVPDCPVCKRQVSSLGAGNIINPFWTQFKDFFLYPANVNALILMALLSVVMYVVTFVPLLGFVRILGVHVPSNLFFFYLPIVVVFLRYAHMVLEKTARGHSKPISISDGGLTENGATALMMIGVIVIFNLLNYFAFQTLGTVAYHVMNVLTTFAIPASIMILALEGNHILHALNPLIIFGLIARIGWPYLAMFILAYFLVSIPDVLIDFFADQFMSSASFNFILAVFWFFIMYFMLIIFRMMGYTLYQYHEELGISIDVEANEHPQHADKKHSHTEASISPHLRAVEILIQEGKIDEAVPQLQAAIKELPSDLEARERMLKLSRLTGDKALHLIQGRDYISYLFHEQKQGPAADVFLACNDYDPDFKPANAIERLEIAKLLKINGNGKRALTILNGMHQEFPSFDGVPQAYLMVAQLMCEYFSEDGKAKQILTFILNNYPGHALETEVKEYMKIIDGLSNH